MSAFTSFDDAALVLGALENERCLDLRYKELNPNLDSLASLPNYKVMKQLALRAKLGRYHRVLVLVAVVVLPILAIAQAFAACVVSTILPTKRIQDGAVVIVPTSTNNVQLILDVISRLIPTSKNSTTVILPSWNELARVLSASEVLGTLLSLILLFGRIMGSKGRRLDLFLHARDAVALLLLLRLARSRPDVRFATECHYQRWSFLLSHGSPHLTIVQHGFLDPGIRFAFAFGKPETVCMWDAASELSFRNYYSAREMRVLKRRLRLTDHPRSEDAVLLASSFPFVDQEVQFLRELKARTGKFVILKLHPNHRYDGKAETLRALTDFECAPHEFPRCRIFVSYNSSLEFEYAAAGITTFSIERDGPAKTAAAVAEAAS